MLGLSCELPERFWYALGRLPRSLRHQRTTVMERHMIVEVCSRLHHRRPRPLSVGQILVGVWIGISNCRSCFILHVCPSLDGLLQVRFQEFSLGALWHVWFRASGLSVYAAFTPARMKPLKDSAREGRVNPFGVMIPADGVRCCQSAAASRIA